ncbi:MAG: hypothetical protein K2G46_02780 [Bacteroidales bacterium]|nr:hypothetical protein [Bacteroidales bacterium]
MKKVMFVLAVASMFALCSCKSNQPAEEVEAVETEVVAEEGVCPDAEAAAEEVPAEEVVVAE